MTLQDSTASFPTGTNWLLGSTQNRSRAIMRGTLQSFWQKAAQQNQNADPRSSRGQAAAAATGAEPLAIDLTNEEGADPPAGGTTVATTNNSIPSPSPPTATPTGAAAASSSSSSSSSSDESEGGEGSSDQSEEGEEGEDDMQGSAAWDGAWEEGDDPDAGK
jgi:hypothetical protein